ncbi:MAG TPA: DNA/RNA non-specific endonuclease [Prevotellaceae bacterium]|nr:DNA/RNA non-specific endonuclease [Prevotellaceae bacterium]
MRMKYVLLLATLFLAACGEDLPTPSGGDANTNSNAALVGPAGESHVTESSGTNCAQVSMRLEMPHLKGGTQNLFVVHTLGDGTVNYCMEYDCSLRASRWTAYRWYRGLSSKETAWNRNNWKHGYTFNGYGGRSDPFQPDPLIPSQYQSTLADHAGNGYDRGHMLGSADRLNSKDANGQTFYLSNMHPQLSGFNQKGIWYNLENRLRNEYDKDSFRDTLYVVKGGTIAQGQYKKGKNNLPVPKYFYMAILCKNGEKTQGGYKAIAFWMEHKSNEDTNFAKYAISIDELEKKTGIDFFCNLPDDIESRVESNLVPGAWGLR